MYSTCTYTNPYQQRSTTTYVDGMGALIGLLEGSCQRGKKGTRTPSLAWLACPLLAAATLCVPSVCHSVHAICRWGGLSTLLRVCYAQRKVASRHRAPVDGRKALLPDARFTASRADGENPSVLSSMQVVPWDA
ncbi:uncharacterized protein P884DRAFT_9055 [Thermothelomyces heterothallicus CBS 202.75]|uniref:uncharacterized protein n=1 Tax=Thermothelomyces heterothallicus CBS 202.75 TaxID=1149848 RepID=UPI00374436D4